MVIHRIVSPALGANCYVLIPATGGALVVDPGAHTADAVAALLADQGRACAAVLATHGHPDHVWDAAAVAGDAPVLVPAPDRYRMADPDAALPAGFDFAAIAGAGYVPPANVRTLDAAFATGGGAEIVPGVAIRAVPAPGHTEGSTVFLTRGTLAAGIEGATGEQAPILLSGDVLFAGAMGRTDLPGGDEKEMRATLRTLTTVIDPATVVMPGHGPATMMGRELESNPFLAFRS